MDTLTQMREELVAAYAPGGRLHLVSGHPSTVTQVKNTREFRRGRGLYLGMRQGYTGPSRRTLNKRAAKRARS